MQIPTDENVIRLRACASNLEELHKVKKLAMDITADLIRYQVSSQLVIYEAHGSITYGHWGVDDLDITLLY